MGHMMYLQSLAKESRQTLYINSLPLLVEKTVRHFDALSFFQGVNEIFVRNILWYELSSMYYEG